MIRKHRITLAPTTALGDALNTATATLTLGRPGFVRAIAVDHTGSGNAERDLTIKADSASGATLFTVSNSETDITAKPVAMPGVDEGGAATAATDLGAGGWPFGTGLYFSCAQMDDAVTTVVDVWLET